MLASLENPAVATGLEKVNPHPNSQEGQYWRMFKTPDNCSHLLMLVRLWLKILHARIQHCVNWEFPDVQAGYRNGRGTRDQIANICWIIEKAREFQKNIYLCFIDNAKAFDCVDHKKPWKILKEMGRSDHLTCLLQNLYAGQKATVRTGHGATD